MAIRTVLDANILVSAALVKIGKPARIVHASAPIQVLTSEGILTEVRRALHYPRIQKRYSLSTGDIDEYINDLVAKSTVVDVRTQVIGVSRDPDDDKILACAVDGKADYIVTGDPHLLNLGVYEGINIVTPNAFLSILEAQSE